MTWSDFHKPRFRHGLVFLSHSRGYFSRIGWVGKDWQMGIGGRREKERKRKEEIQEKRQNKTRKDRRQKTKRKERRHKKEKTEETTWKEKKNKREKWGRRKGGAGVRVWAPIFLWVCWRYSWTCSLMHGLNWEPGKRSALFVCLIMQRRSLWFMSPFFSPSSVADELCKLHPHRLREETQYLMVIPKIVTLPLLSLSS